MVRFIIYNLGGTKNFNNKGDRKTSNMPSVDKNWFGLANMYLFKVSNTNTRGRCEFKVSNKNNRRH